MSKPTNLIGQVFSRLTVIAMEDKPGDNAYVLCRCECGTEKRIAKRHVVSGAIRSCGCLLRETFGTIKPSLTHGLSNTAEYRCWNAARQRCINPKQKSFADYGARGIRMCQRWIDSFENFLSDMGEKPGPEYTIEREDNNGNYEPGNCKWATRHEQAMNTRSSVKVTVNGVTLPLMEWSEKSSIAYHTLKCRILRGWPEERLLDPIRGSANDAKHA